MNQVSDSNVFYGRYVTKKEPAVPLSVCRKIENECSENATKHRIAAQLLWEANQELDKLGIPRKQVHDPHYPLNIVGRIRSIKPETLQVRYKDSDIIIESKP